MDRIPPNIELIDSIILLLHLLMIIMVDLLVKSIDTLFACSVGYSPRSTTLENIIRQMIWNHSSFVTLIDYSMEPTHGELLNHCRGNTPALHQVDKSIMS